MSAPMGNEFWKLRSKSGRDLIFSTPENLMKACIEYFETTTQLQLDEQSWVGRDGGEVQKHHPLPFTIKGLCIFIHITFTTWQEYKKRQDFTDVCIRAEEIIYVQKFNLAVTGFFNANIIARDLGLTDKKDLTSSDGTMATKPTIVVSDEKTAEELKKIIDKK